MGRIPPAVSLPGRHQNHLQRPRPVRRLSAAGAAIALAVALSACGSSRINHPTTADQGNLYVWAGPMTYQVQVTRELNPYSTEDAEYLAGVPGAQTIPGSDLWFGVFLWAKNQSGHRAATTDHITVTDSSGTVYNPVTLNPQLNQYAWTSQQLGPDGTEPAPDTTASYGPTQGGLLLFKLSDSVYANRPLTLNIYAPGSTKPTTVALDL